MFHQNYVTGTCTKTENLVINCK